jgi:hypothetical protein
MSILAIFSVSLLAGCPGGDGSEDSSTTEFDSDFQGANGPLQGRLVYEKNGLSRILDLASGQYDSFDPHI